LSHVLRKTLCEHVNGLCPAGWLNEQSITKHSFQSVRICPYSWATGCNSSNKNRSSSQKLVHTSAKQERDITRKGVCFIYTYSE